MLHWLSSTSKSCNILSTFCLLYDVEPLFFTYYLWEDLFSFICLETEMKTKEENLRPHPQHSRAYLWKALAGWNLLPQCSQVRPLSILLEADQPSEKTSLPHIFTLFSIKSSSSPDGVTHRKPLQAGMWRLVASPSLGLTSKNTHRGEA